MPIPNFRAVRWVNSPPLTADALHGQVVLVDFWEYTCINWIRTSPYVKTWHRLRRSGPGRHRGACAGVRVRQERREFDRGIRDHGLTYPIALDTDFAVWRAFGNKAWPAKYLFDAAGRLVDRWIGEGCQLLPAE